MKMENEIKYFVVNYIHADKEGWTKYLSDHVTYLHNLLQDGSLVVSGPFVGTAENSAMLILSATSLQEALKVLDRDPYIIQGLVSNLTITEWDPIFGNLNNQ
jgi:uncharacterized protein YciI